MNRRHLIAFVTTLLAAGCAAPLPAAPAGPPASTVMAPPPPPAPATVTAQPSATPEAPALSAFTKVAEVGTGPTLYQLGKRVFIGRRDGATFLEVKGGKIGRADAESPGLAVCKNDGQERFQQPGALYGDFDKAAFLSELSHGARTTSISMDRWDGAHWRSTRLPEFGGQLTIGGSFRWRKSTLLLVNWSGHSTVLNVLEGPDKAPSFAAMPEPWWWQQTRMLGYAAVKTREGELVVAGFDGNAPLVERWWEADAVDRLETLPLAAGETGGRIAALAGTSSHELYAGGSADPDKRSYLARFDGKQWSRLETPLPSAITHLVLAPDGALWAVEHGDREGFGGPSTVWRRRDGAWSRVPASDEQGKPLAIQGLWVLDDGDVWLAAGESLYRNRADGPVFTWSDPLCPAISMARPATEGCFDSVFVLLYTLGKTSPKDYDFPLLRQAIKGHREFSHFDFAETEERGRRYLVGFVGSESDDVLALGAKLVKLVTKEVKGSTPALLCGSPRVVRKINIDVISGEVVKK